MATALTSVAAAEKVAHRGTLTVGLHRFTVAPTPQPVHQNMEALPLQEWFGVLVSEAYPEHAHKVRAVLCGYLLAERARTKEQAKPSALCTVEFRCPQCQPGQTTAAGDAEYSTDKDVNSDGLNRQKAVTADDDDRFQHARNIIATQARRVSHLRMRNKELTQHTGLHLNAVPLAPTIKQRLEAHREETPPRPSTAWKPCHSCQNTMAFGGTCLCHEAMYYNERCQHDHWSVHKTTCSHLIFRHPTHLYGHVR
jgi:hypothetical protein